MGHVLRFSSVINTVNALFGLTRTF